jgi:L-lactate dehydrogenase complex protein LldF
MKKEFKASISRAVNDANLTGALGKFSEAYRVNRAKAYEGIDFEELRGKVAEAKSAAASRLEELAGTFQKNAEALGAKVFRTKSPQEVKEYILRVAREHGVKSVVKSKSMATEEIHLNPFLQENGISVAETDLGEWIIQLAGQRPSHIDRKSVV